MVLDMNCKNEVERIVKFLKGYNKKAGAEGYVLGVSGGLDSAVVYKLCVKAVGKDNVTTWYNTGNNNIYKLVKMLDSDVIIDDVSDYVNRITDCEMDELSEANVKSRIMMVHLYMFANYLNCLVVGTTNKSEYMIGYFTKFGDGASDIEPIQHLYKTEVYELAKYLKVPNSIIKAKPSAGLWEGQIDEDEIGMSYEKLDKILEYFEQPHLLVGNVFNYGITEGEIKRVEKMIESTEHKRRLPKNLMLTTMCGECGSSDVALLIGGGYVCKKCSYLFNPMNDQSN